jgi:hypothetical protein
VYAALGSGVGFLDAGNTSTYVTILDPLRPAGALPNFTMICETVHLPAAASPLNATFALLPPAPGAPLPAALNAWLTSADGTVFVRQADVPIDPTTGTFSLSLAAGTVMTLTTATGGAAPAPSRAVPPSAPFPFP